MTNKAQTGFEILVSAIVMGLAADTLLRDVPWGLNAFVFVLMFVAALSFLSLRHRPEIISPPALALKSAILFFATMFLIRDSAELKVFDTLAMVVLLGVLILRTFPIDIVHAGVSHYAAGLLWAGINSIFAPFLLIGSDIDRRELAANRWVSTTVALIRGLVIALPLILVFGLLFMSADSAFDHFVRRITAFRFDKIVSHIALTSVFAVLTASYFRGTLMQPFAGWRSAGRETKGSLGFSVEKSSPEDDLNKEENDTPVFTPGKSVLEHINNADASTNDRENIRTGDTKPFSVAAKIRQFDFQNYDNSFLPQGFTLGVIETGVVFGLVNLVFLSFVVFQIPYLFGGLDFVHSTPDLKLADFARSGFAELVFASVLVLPMLLVGHWLLRRDSKSTANLFKVLALIQIGLLFVVMASAMQRLLLLTGEVGYGWTPTRFYPAVLMFWLGIVFIWFIFTVLFGNRQRFAWGSLWFAIVILGAVNLFNPDAFIVEKNLQLMRQGRQFDAYTNAGLGGETVPILLRSLPEMTQYDQCRVKLSLHSRLNKLKTETNPGLWNLQRQKALQTLEAAHKTLDQHEGCPAWMDFRE